MAWIDDYKRELELSKKGKVDQRPPLSVTPKGIEAVQNWYAGYGGKGVFADRGIAETSPTPAIQDVQMPKPRGSIAEPLAPLAGNVSPIEAVTLSPVSVNTDEGGVMDISAFQKGHEYTAEDFSRLGIPADIGESATGTYSPENRALIAQGVADKERGIEEIGGAERYAMNKVISGMTPEQQSTYYLQKGQQERANDPNIKLQDIESNIRNRENDIAALEKHLMRFPNDRTAKAAYASKQGALTDITNQYMGIIGKPQMLDIASTAEGRLGRTQGLEESKQVFEQGPKFATEKAYKEKLGEGIAAETRGRAPSWEAQTAADLEKVKAGIKPVDATSRKLAAAVDLTAQFTDPYTREFNQTGFDIAFKRMMEIIDNSETKVTETPPPQGAKPLNKTIGGKPAYQLPNGKIWTP